MRNLDSGQALLPTAWALATVVVFLVAMIIGAWRRGLLSSLLGAGGSGVWIGGALLLLAGFFPYGVGPYGAELSVYTHLRWNSSLAELPYVVMFDWSMVLGFALAALGYVSLIERSVARSAHRLRIGIASTLIALTLFQSICVAWMRFGTIPRSIAEACFMGAPPTVLVATLVVLVVCRGDALRCSSWLSVVAGTWVMLADLPGIVTEPGDLRFPGLVVRLAGAVALIALGTSALRRATIVSHVLCACGYDLTGNESGICPECGRVITPGSRAERD